MIRFTTAALVCGGIVVLGAVTSGAGTTDTLGRLGAVDARAGAFTCALAAGLTVYYMTRWGLPVSTTQAIVGPGVMRGGRDVDWCLVRNIGLGWLTTPLVAAVVCVVALFFVQNAFDQPVHREK